MEKDIVKNAVDDLTRNVEAYVRRKPITFQRYLKLLSKDPHTVIRSIFQTFHDMIKHYVGEGFDEYPNDPESIGFVHYDCNPLFVEKTDRPFFADRLFANRLVNLIKALRKGAQQNKIYIFEGPPGCGKSTFLNNLLYKFQKYANKPAGAQYETVWRLKRKELGGFIEEEALPLIEQHTAESLQHPGEKSTSISRPAIIHETDEYVEIPCPSHDNPILMIPKSLRREFFDNIFKNDKFKWKLFTEKEYEWVFKKSPCTICSSIYIALTEKLDHPSKVFQMLYTQQYYFNRRLGEGISVFNPGDKPLRRNVLTNEMLQHRLDSLLKDSNRVKYIFSNFSRTNNGIYALMDIKSNNTERLIELHNIVSEGIHKVEHIEENVHSLFLALMNPEDKKNIEGIQSFLDRVEYIKIPYVLDIRTEVEIYRNIFGKHIDANFLPKVLLNFARIIIASRLKKRSPVLFDWIKDPDQYSLYCDKNLHLLKMEMYTGYIPTWLSDTDLKNFTAKNRKKLIAESEFEGETGFSGRESINIFNDFYSTYASEDKLINMSMLIKYFNKIQRDQPDHIPEGFMDSLCKMYDYNILQEVKESLYHYNEEKISADIQDYLFAISFEPETVVKSKFTRKKLKITEKFFENIEKRLLGDKVSPESRLDFRKNTQKLYTSNTLTQEIMVEGKKIFETQLYQALLAKYIYNLKERVLEPFLENENFRRAIKDFDTEVFKTYDRKIRADVTQLIRNLTKKFKYPKKGAKEVCIYVVDMDLAKKFAKE